MGVAQPGDIPGPRASLLQTNPILAALVEQGHLPTNRRISAGFIVEAATGTTDPRARASYLLLDNLPVISTTGVLRRGNH